MVARAILSILILGLAATSLVGPSGASEELVQAPLKVVVVPDSHGKLKMNVSTLAVADADLSELGIGAGGAINGPIPKMYAIVEGKFDRAKLETYAKPSGKFSAGEREGLTTFTATSTDGTATAGEDFTALARSVRLLPGARKSIPIPFIDDDAAEPTEAFLLTLHAKGKKGQDTKQVVVIILDDDAEPTPSETPVS